MLAIIYLVVMYLLGDVICRRYYPFLSRGHRFAAAFTTGLLVSSWWTYLCALLFSWTPSPMLWGNVVSLITAGAVIFWLWTHPSEREHHIDRAATEFRKWDWVFVGFFVIYSGWLMFGTFSMGDGNIMIANHEASDFGSNVSIMQSFALGNNFPTMYPHFTGERIRYHFLFYFQSGNLEYLGLNPANSNNILSFFSLIAMLILVMTLGAVAFGSRVVGRIGAFLFIFHGSLSFIPYVYDKGSVSAAARAVWSMVDFLPSGYPYRGELWGVWSQVVYANQRHLASSVAIFLMVVIFLFVKYRELPDGPSLWRKLLAARKARQARQRAIMPERGWAQPVPEAGESIDREPLGPIDPFASEAETPDDDRRFIVVPPLVAEKDAGIQDQQLAEENTPGGPKTFHTAEADLRVSSPADSEQDVWAPPPIEESEREAEDKHQDETRSSASESEKDERQEMRVPPLDEGEETVEEPEADLNAGDPVSESVDNNGHDSPLGTFRTAPDRTVKHEPSQKGEDDLLELPPIVPADVDPYEVEEVNHRPDREEEPRDLLSLSEPEILDETTDDEVVRTKWFEGGWFGGPVSSLPPYIFAGILLGLMPLWNGAIFTAAFAVLACMLVLFPLRRQTIIMGIATGAFALPQLLYLRGGIKETWSLLHFGYIVDPPSITAALSYMGFIFGMKLFLVALALIVGTSLQRRLFLAASSLIGVTFLFQFSPELLANHKFLNVWLIIANLFAAAGLIVLWKFKLLRTTIPGKLIAFIFMTLIVVGGFIDLFPIHNSSWTTIPFTNDPLVTWLRQNTDPKSIFLTERYVNHAILLSGRRIFYGHPYYAWGAGYDTTKRDGIYKEMLESKDIAKVFRLLKENNISYIAIDNGIRKGDGYIKSPNESLLVTYFPTAFSDDDHKYNDLRILQVPEALPEGAPSAEIQPEIAITNAFESRSGDALGLFSRPRGIATDSKGFFYVADTDNARVQKFDADGKFVAVIGSAGAFDGQMKEPNGLAIDRSGNIYVTDSHNHKLMKYGPDGKFLKEWKGPDSGFYGPRDIAIGPNEQLYVIDQGRTRIARFDPATESFNIVWGSSGPGEGQFSETTGITLANDKVVVADLGNRRIQVFDLNGVFIRQWEVPSWEKSAMEYPDVVYDEQGKRLYVTSGKTNELLAFDLDGNRIDDLGLQTGERLDNPSSLAILETSKKRWLLVLNTGSSRVTKFELEAKKGK